MFGQGMVHGMTRTINMWETTGSGILGRRLGE
jgi:hypothetical protein